MTDVHYHRAPILEAVIDIQVRFNPQPEPAAFLQIAQQFAQHVDGRYRQAMSLPSNVGLAVGSGGSRLVNQGGLRLSTAQNDRVLLLQPRGLVFSHMPPYTRWKTFRDEAVELWQLFVNLARPEAVTRTALRYINRFEIPRGSFELSDYFSFYPEVPNKCMPKHISHLFMQCQIPQSDLGDDVTATINLGSAGIAPSGWPLMLLDFDLIAMRECAPDSGTIMDLLDCLRVRKNELFEACITDRARELIR